MHADPNWEDAEAANKRYQRLVAERREQWEVIAFIIRVTLIIVGTVIVIHFAIKFW